MTKLTQVQVEVSLGRLPNWTSENNTLVRTYKKKSFMDSILFVEQIAKLAEEANHHPDLLIQYDKVTVKLTTHDNNGITGKDFALAQQIDTLH